MIHNNKHADYKVISGKLVVIDPFRFIVIVNRKEHVLYPKEFDVLYCLASHPGWVLSAEQIYDEVWGEDVYGFEYIIYNTISQIRKKLGMPHIIQTVKGRGYRFADLPETLEKA